MSDEPITGAPYGETAGTGAGRKVIAVAGLGYVGLSNALVLAKRNRVVALDVDARRVALVNERRSPIAEADIVRYLAEEQLDLAATLDPHEAYGQAGFVVVATPTNYDPAANSFDTSAVESVIADVIRINPDATIVIKSTVPVGFTDRMRRETGRDNIVFSPEFLREGRALHDSLHPTRIVVGERSPRAEAFASLLSEAALANDVPVVFTGSREAEALKLFANSYLAMRVCFFNELDSYAMAFGLDAREIIDGICLDPRIGAYYNNPSFGYGGYCLPKDSRELLANYGSVPQNIIGAIVDSNETRKDVIAEAIAAQRPAVVGIYRLTMKAGADNFRTSAIEGVVERLLARGLSILVYEPLAQGTRYKGAPVTGDLERFKAEVDLIVANRPAEELSDVAEKLFTRDLYGIN